MVRKKERRTLHFDLSGSPAGVQHTMHIGGRRIALEPHTDETRARYREKNGLLQKVPDARLTHHAPDVDTFADALQSYYVTHPPAKGAHPNLALAGILVPKAHLRRAHRLLGGVHNGPYNGKLRRLGVVADGDGQPVSDPQWLDEGDLADFQDMTEAATYMIYHHPNLVTLSASADDSDTALTIIAAIQAVPPFDNLVAQITQQGPAQNLDGWNQGYQGWANAEEFGDLLNPNAAKQWWYTYTDQTNAAALPVIQQAQTAVRNIGSLDGNTFKVDYGSHNTPVTNPATTTSDAGGGRRALSIRPRAMVGDGGYQFSLTDPDFNHGRQVVIGETSGRTVTFTVNNS